MVILCQNCMEIIALSGVVYLGKQHWSQLRATWDSIIFLRVWLNLIVSLIFTDWFLFFKQQQDQIWAYPDIPDLYDRLSYYVQMGGGPRVVVSTAAFHARVRGSIPGLGG